MCNEAFPAIEPGKCFIVQGSSDMARPPAVTLASGASFEFIQ
jgi:hypothetical protein